MHLLSQKNENLMLTFLFLVLSYPFLLIHAPTITDLQQKDLHQDKCISNRTHQSHITGKNYKKIHETQSFRRLIFFSNFKITIDNTKLHLYNLPKVFMQGQCRAPLLEECPQHHGHKGDPGVTPGTCVTIGERAQVILVWVRAPGR